MFASGVLTHMPRWPTLNLRLASRLGQRQKRSGQPQSQDSANNAMLRTLAEPMRATKDSFLTPSLSHAYDRNKTSAACARRWPRYTGSVKVGDEKICICLVVEERWWMSAVSDEPGSSRAKGLAPIGLAQTMAWQPWHAYRQVFAHSIFCGTR